MFLLVRKNIKLDGKRIFRKSKIEVKEPLPGQIVQLLKQGVLWVIHKDKKGKFTFGSGVEQKNAAASEPSKAKKVNADVTDPKSDADKGKAEGKDAAKTEKADGKEGKK